MFMHSLVGVFLGCTALKRVNLVLTPPCPLFLSLTQTGCKECLVSSVRCSLHFHAVCFAAFPRVFVQVGLYRSNTPGLRVHYTDESPSRAKQPHWLRLSAVLNTKVHIYNGSTCIIQGQHMHHVLHLWATDQSVNSS